MNNTLIQYKTFTHYKVSLMVILTWQSNINGPPIEQ
jgi:hypothetical protein